MGWMDYIPMIEIPVNKIFNDEDVNKTATPAGCAQIGLYIK